MPLLTLAETKVGYADKTSLMIIDEFQIQSPILSILPFENAVSPTMGGGSTLVYSYLQKKKPSTAHFRAINTDYTANMSLRKLKSATLKIFGGRITIDRVLQDTSGFIDEMANQLKEKVLGTVNLFHYTLINGDSATDVLSFDGLEVLLDGTKTEYDGELIDISTPLKTAENAETFDFKMQEWLSTFGRKPQMLLMNKLTAVRLKVIARQMGFYDRSKDDFGRTVDMYDGIPFYDLEDFYDETDEKTKPIVGIEADGTTTIYGLSFGEDAVHGVSPVGDKIIKTYNTEGNVDVMRNASVEMVACVVVKNTLNAGKMINIKVK